MGKPPIKIALADAQYLTRAGFRYLFGKQAQIEVVGEATDMGELRTLVAEKAPQMIVIDHFNSSEFTLAHIAELRRDHPGIEVFVVTDDQDRGRIRQILDLKINCILTKHCSPEEIVSAVIAVSKGEKFFCNKVLEVILEHDAPSDDCSPSNLSPREIEIVRLVASGVTTKDIADQLCLSTHTVYTHRKNIMKKLQIRSASEMILYAMNTGIVGK